jgi:hypothetical protein
VKGIVNKNKVTDEDGNVYTLIGCYNMLGEVDRLYMFPQGYEIDFELLDGKAVKTYAPPIKEFKTRNGYARVYKKE